MDTSRILAELRAEREQIEGLIAAFEQLARNLPRRRGRPPKWLKEFEAATPRRRRKGQKNKESAAKG